MRSLWKCGEWIGDVTKGGDNGVELRFDTPGIDVGDDCDKGEVSGFCRIYGSIIDIGMFVFSIIVFISSYESCAIYIRRINWNLDKKM